MRSRRSWKQPSITEAEFERQVKQLAATFGFSYYHTWRSIHSPAGYPDCCLAKPGRLVFAELKSDKGKVSEKQQEWLDDLEATGAETYVWRPSQFDEVVEILRDGARQPHIEPTKTPEREQTRRGGHPGATEAVLGDNPSQEEIKAAFERGEARTK